MARAWWCRFTGTPGRRPDGRVLDSQEALFFGVVDGLVTSVRNYYRDTDEVVWRT